MIGFALPWVLGVAMAGVLAISALHLLSVRRPPELLLPTARFLPERDVRAVSRTRRPSDVLLLLVRIAALAAAGLAAAAPAWQSRARGRVTLVVADRWITWDTVAMRALVQDGSALRVVFASAHADSSAVRNDDPAALVPVAWREASLLARSDASIDSIDLHLLLSDAPATSDAGFAAWRAAWPGRVTTHHVATEHVPRRVVILAGDSVGMRSADDDAVRAAFAWHAARVSRAGAGRADTIVVTRSDAPVGMPEAFAPPGVVVRWPLHGVPTGWVATTTPADSAAALAVSGRALMGPFPVTAVAPAGADTSMAPIAWWSDGRVAATERRTASACDRSVALTSASASDVLLSASANALFDRLLAPCERRAPVDASTLRVTDTKAGALAGADVFRSADGSAARAAGGSAWIVPLLLALSLLLLVVEWRIRARESVSVA